MAKNKGGFIGQFGLEAPDTPTGVSATAGDEQATVVFTAPTDVGGDAITSYRAQSNDGISGTSTSSPVTVTGLTNGTSYTFEVWAINRYGESTASDASGSVTPNVLQRALFGGGYGYNTIDYVDITSAGNATDFGDLLDTAQRLGAAASTTRAIWFGGGDPSGGTNVIQYVTITSTGNAADFGDLLSSEEEMMPFSNNTRGLAAGDASASSTVIQYVTIASTGNAADFGDMSPNTQRGAGTANSTRGLICGGVPFGTPTNQIQYVTISSLGNGTDFGDMTLVRGRQAALASSTRAVNCGGETTSAALTNVMDYVTIASTGNATDFGDLTSSVRYCGATSGLTKGVIALGRDASNDLNTIDQITIATTANSTDFGDLSVVRRATGATSSAHGGTQ